MGELSIGWRLRVGLDVCFGHRVATATSIKDIQQQQHILLRTRDEQDCQLTARGLQEGLQISRVKVTTRAEKVSKTKTQSASKLGPVY
uniref:Uncharacterized protein n=1 Tax=Hyaloperonospora arabidopsidis (strain Emoy2) TaxID=559515 RepID=M4B9R4_HYAAE